MTRSRDLYKEAAEQALEALAAYRDVPAPVLPPQRPTSGTPGALQQLTRTFERLRFTAKGRRQSAPASLDPAESGGAERADGTERSS